MARGIVGSSRTGRLAALVAAALVFAACAPLERLPLYTPLEVAGSFGYEEQRLSERRFRVTYHAPIVATYAYSSGQRRQEVAQEVALAYDLALWRAAELALEAGYPALTVAERNNDSRVEVFGDPYYDPFVYPGYPFLYPPYPFFHYGPPFGHLRQPFYSSYYQPYAELMVSVTITVAFGEDQGAGALHARTTLERLREQYPDAVAAPPP